MKILVLILLLAFPALGLAQSTDASGVEGSILIGPLPGGPVREGAPDTAPLPRAEFEVRQGDRIVTTFLTDAEGRFRVSLAPGHYSVAKKDKGRVGFFGPFEVEVAAGKMKSVQWKCDSGIQ